MPDMIEELAEKRCKWVEANRENGFEEGIKRLLTDLYPDNAHFIYELLQYAEDAHAKEVHFILYDNRIEVEHNGEKFFSIQDVNSITSIGFSTKRDDATNIGKFGVGFKAVYAYTDSPKIESGDFNFRIRDMVVPERSVPSDWISINDTTRFILPFNNPKKPPKQAVTEIERLLRALDANTLLFLTHIQKIEYLLPDTSLGYIERIERGNNRFEIRVQQPDQLSPLSTWFLMFDKIVQVEDEEIEKEENRLKDCRVAVAFGLSPVEAKADSDKNKTDDKILDISKWKLVSMNPGRVCIYFPADKETSNLRFHLHAPFASTVARDSIRDCAGNHVLRDHLADLLAESMHEIRDQDLLNVRSLSLLPNDKDNLNEFYIPLMTRLVKEFKEQDLVPMKRGEYAAASGIFRGPRVLSDLINDDDMVKILGDNYISPMWVANPSQLYQREDNFLSMLAIKEWSTSDFVEALNIMNDDFRTKWMQEKDEEWHQALYELLMDYLNAAPKYPPFKAQERKSSISRIALVRVSNGTYRKGGYCYFPTDDVEFDERFPRVAKGVFTTDKGENEKVLKFFEEIGVQEVDEKVEIEHMLKEKYSSAARLNSMFSPDINHIKRFAKFTKEYPDSARLFKDYFILKVDNGDWHTPKQVYLDKPYKNTGLRAYYEALGEKASLRSLSLEYQELELTGLVEFVEKVGATASLHIDRVSCFNNPQWKYLAGAPGGYGKFSEEDYCIDKLDELLEIRSLELSQLVWKTMCRADELYLSARYKKSDKGGYRYAKSQLVHVLNAKRWVPQNNSTFVRPFDAFRDQLPDGFPYDQGQKWLTEIEFGKGIEEQKKAGERKYNIVKELGVSLEDIEFLKNHREEVEQLKAALAARNERPTFPTRPVANQERRQERLGEQLIDAPQKKYEKRERSVCITNSAIDPVTWLRNQYTNDDGQMVCQICKEEMPFRKRNGEFYFEKRELLSKDHLTKLHEAQYLALCPLCWAKYGEFILKDEVAMVELKEAIIRAEDCEIPISLGDEKTSIRFVGIHFHDLKSIIFDAIE